MPRYVIGLGSSHPMGISYIQRAIFQLGCDKRIQILRVADIIRSCGVDTGRPLQFVNCAAFIKSPLPAVALWFLLSAIEAKLGRIRTTKNAPRTLDLDLLYSPDISCNQPFVQLPHPRLHERDFAKVPARQCLKHPIPICLAR